MNASRILIRVTALDEHAVAFGTELATASGYPVSFVVDERVEPTAPTMLSVVGVSEQRCRALGLYCPADFAWRCGDYGYYLARRQFPEVRSFWLIEYDVRFTGDTLAAFFEFFDQRPEVDLLATDLREAGLTWHWTSTCLGRDVAPWRCLFPITRLSRSAIDALLDKRRRHSRDYLRRSLWPNDEGMVATTLKNAGFECRDLNSFGSRYYDSQTFTFERPAEGEALEKRSGPTRIHHPVLYGMQYRDKLARVQLPETIDTGWRKLRRRVCQALNRRARW